jgi:hypothetical protein
MSTSAPVSAQISDYLKELNRSTARACFADVVRQAQQETLSYEAFLLELLGQEVQGRRHRRIERLLHGSRLPLEKSLVLMAAQNRGGGRGGGPCAPHKSEARGGWQGSPQRLGHASGSTWVPARGRG